jgi:Holliday junction DNA helicase RuvB
VGLSTLAVAVGEEPETVETVAEPFLVREGLLGRTPRGRVATPDTWLHLGLNPPSGYSWAGFSTGSTDGATTPRFGGVQEPLPDLGD